MRAMRLGRKKTGPPAAKNRDGRQVYKLAGGDLDRDCGVRGVDQMTVSRSYADSVGCSLCLMEDGKQSSLGSTERNVVQTNAKKCQQRAQSDTMANRGGVEGGLVEG